MGLNYNMPPIVFFGTEEHSLIALKALYEAQFPIAAVITKPDAPKGRGGKITEPAVKKFAHAHNIPVWQPTRLKDVYENILALESPIGVLVSYGKIIPQSIIDLFTPGIINLHPSLLPKYRGPSPIEAAMINLDDTTGVSIMKLDAKMDAGPIYCQTEIPLTQQESRTELYNKLFSIGSKKLVEVLPQIVNNNLQPTPQNHKEATYCQLLSKDNSLLDPTVLTATQAEARVRAYIGFPRTKITVNDQQIIITKAHIAPQPETIMDQCFTDNNYLIVDEIISPVSGKTMPTQSYLNGLRA